MFKNFTRLEKSWILYDIGNSAFTLMVTTLIPVWFSALFTAEGYSNSEYLAYWSYATSVTTILVAVLGPILGTLSDNRGFKKPMFMTVLIIGVIGCFVMGGAPGWMLYIVTYIIAKICYQLSLVFYDSMLTDVTTPERMDIVSSQGYAWGYIGSCIPFIIALLFYVLGEYMHRIPTAAGIAMGFAVTGIWWFCVSMPLMKNYKQKHYMDHEGNMAGTTFRRLGETLKEIVKSDRKVLFFLLAFFFYIDGVYTIIDESVAIGTAMGINTVGLLVVLLFTQVVAFAFASLFGKLTEKYDPFKILSVCIAGYLAVAVYALFLHTLWQFGIMAFIVGMFQGTIQALSRSYYGKIIPSEKSGEYFGLLDICGKGAAFMGTLLIGVTVHLTGSVNIAVFSLAILFGIGWLFLRKSSFLPAMERNNTAE